MVSIKKRFKKGFTLIELIIATSLLMLVMFSGYYAYSLYSQKWQKRVEFFWSVTEQAIALDSLHKLLSSAMPYIVNGKENKACIYFKGSHNSVSFISSSAIFSTEPALIQLQLESIPNNDHFNLIYQEQSITHSLVLEITHQAQWQHKIILLTNITNFNLSYFGWSSFQEAVKQLNSDALVKKDTRTWYSNHQSNVSRLLPEKIKVSFFDNKGNNDFQIALPQHSLNRLLAYIRVDA